MGYSPRGGRRESALATSLSLSKQPEKGMFLPVKPLAAMLHSLVLPASQSHRGSVYSLGNQASA